MASIAKPARSVRVGTGCAYFCTCAWFTLAVTSAALFGWAFSEMQCNRNNEAILRKMSTTFDAMNIVSSVGRTVNVASTSTAVKQFYTETVPPGSGYYVDYKVNNSLYAKVMDFANNANACFKAYEQQIIQNVSFMNNPTSFVAGFLKDSTAPECNTLASSVTSLSKMLRGIVEVFMANDGPAEIIFDIMTFPSDGHAQLAYVQGDTLRTDSWRVIVTCKVKDETSLQNNLVEGLYITNICTYKEDSETQNSDSKCTFDFNEGRSSSVCSPGDCTVDLYYTELLTSQSCIVNIFEDIQELYTSALEVDPGVENEFPVVACENIDADQCLALPSTVKENFHFCGCDGTLSTDPCDVKTNTFFAVDTTFQACTQELFDL